MPPKKRLRQTTLDAFTKKRGGEEAQQEDGLFRKRARNVPSPKQALSWQTYPYGLITCKTFNFIERLQLVPDNDTIKIASFDLDSTLIVTSSGAKFPKYSTDWQFMNTRIRPMIQKKVEEGYWIIVFTNQRSVAKGKINVEFLQERLQSITNSLNVPIAFYIATFNNRYRKPGKGMWEQLVQDFCGKGKIDLNEAFYVGDAAGRLKGRRRKQDYSDSDRKFAINVGIRFYTPEQCFENSKESLDKVPLKGFDPRSLEIPDGESLIYGAKNRDFIFQKIIDPPELAAKLLRAPTIGQCMIILVGFPASGKSTLTSRYLEPLGYVRVNNDTLRTKARCLKVARESLKDGKSVVIDNTNPRPDSRKAFIDVAKTHNKEMPIYCIVMKTSREIAEHLNAYRTRLHDNPELFVPPVAYHTFARHFEDPSLKEGISQIGNAKFIPQFLTHDEYKEFLQLS